MRSFFLAQVASENGSALEAKNQKDDVNVSPVSDIFCIATAYEGTAAISGDGGTHIPSPEYSSLNTIVLNTNYHILHP